LNPTIVIRAGPLEEASLLEGISIIMSNYEKEASIRPPNFYGSNFIY